MSKCATRLGLAALYACTAAAGGFPGIESFPGYAHLRLDRGDSGAAMSGNGGAGQWLTNLTGWLGRVADLGAVYNSGFAGLGIDNATFHFLFGPRLLLRERHFRPYAQLLFGAMYYSPGVLSSDEAVSARIADSQTGFALAVGGGIDIRAARRFARRPFELDYFKAQLTDLRTPADSRQNGFRHLAGFNVLFGGDKNAPALLPPEIKTCPNGAAVPVSVSCPKQNLPLKLSGSAEELCPGETALLTASVPGLSNSAVHYRWSVNGRTGAADGPSFVFGTAGLEPGSYSISVDASAGPAFHTATAGTNITVKDYRPPAGTVTANPTQITIGDKSTLTASFSGRCGEPIGAPIFAASEGAVQGNQFDSSSAQFDPWNAAERLKTITITATVTDGKNNTGPAITTIAVSRKPAAVRLPDVLFRHNDACVNNCGKRILIEQLRSYLERDPGGSVLLSGHASSGEEPGIAEQRAMNAAAAITAGAGVCLATPASQVVVSWPGIDQNGFDFDSGFCAPSVGGFAVGSKMRRVVVWFVPSGGTFPVLIPNPYIASALHVGNVGCPK